MQNTFWLSLQVIVVFVATSSTSVSLTTCPLVQPHVSIKGKLALALALALEVSVKPMQCCRVFAGFFGNRLYANVVVGGVDDVCG